MPRFEAPSISTTSRCRPSAIPLHEAHSLQGSPPFGFSRPGARTWLPQPAAWASMTAEKQDGDAASMLSLYRSALALRHTHPGLAGGAFRWIAAPDGELAFERDAGFACLVNISGGQLPLPAGSSVILRSDTGMAARDPLPPDAAAWITMSPRSR